MKHRRRYHLKPDPIGEPRNSLAIYLLALCLLSGLVNMLGYSTSNAVNDALGPLIERTWGGVLFLGCGATLLGMFWQGNPRDGLALKRWGMSAVTTAAWIYSIVVIWQVGSGGLFVGLLTFGLGLAALRHYRKIRRRIELIKRSSP